LNRFYLYISLLFFSSCTIYDKELDNPNDNKANEDIGVYPPSVVLFPKEQTKTISDTVFIGAYIVFSDTSIISFSGAHLNIEYNNSLLEIDSIAPGWIGPGSLTDSNKTTPLFTYTESQGILDIYAYYLSTSDIEIDSLTHIAEIWFKPLSTGESTVRYDTSQCQIIKYDDSIIPINGVRDASVKIQ
tara:strand:+ start:8748 stop:9308 length:561 start_codon:yes stop_codon:yes gene_type:complete